MSELVSETVEGFANYETFSLAVVVDNEQGSREHARAFVWELEQSTDVPGGLDSEGGVRWLRATIGDRLRDYFEQQLPEVESWPGSLMLAGFGRIDWSELADHWTDSEWRSAQ